MAPEDFQGLVAVAIRWDRVVSKVAINHRRAVGVDQRLGPARQDRQVKHMAQTCGHQSHQGLFPPGVQVMAATSDQHKPAGGMP